MSGRTRRLGGLVLAVLWLHQVAIAVLSPLSERDWTVRTDGPIGPSLGALWHWMAVTSQLAHVALTPLAIAALPLGVSVLVRDRDERGDDDVLFLVLVASALWFAVPLFGLACSFRYAAATFLVPLSAAVWYLVALRRVATVGASLGLTISLAIGGVIAGASTPPVALVTLAVAAAMVRRAPRPRQLAALTGLALGAALAVITDWAPMALHLRLHDFEIAVRSLSTQLRVCGWVGAALATLWLGRTAYERWQGRAPRALPVATLDVIVRGLGLGVALALLALATADIGSFQCIASGVVTAAIAATVLVAFARSRRARLAILVGCALVQAKMITSSLRTLAGAHAEYTARRALLAAAPPGTVAVVPPYARRSKDYFFGEDFRTSPRRDRVATLVFGLRGVDVSPERRDVQRVPALAVHHELTGSAAGFPAFYSADLATARDQFAAAVRATHATGARLLVDQLAVPDRPGAPVLAAWLDGEGQPAWWQLVQRRVDREGQLRLVPTGPGLAGDDDAPELTAMWAFDLATGAGQPLARGDDGVFRLRPSRRLNAGLVACTRDRCVLCEVVGLF